MVNFQVAIGRLGRDPEVKFLPSGQSVANFSVATDRSYKDKNTGEWQKKTDWINVVAWGKDWIGQKLHKGDQVYVMGRSETRSYEKNGEKRYSTELVAEDVKKLNHDGGEQSQEGGAGW